MAKKEKAAAEIKYMRVKPATNAMFSIVFIILALLCFMPALLVLIVSFSSESSVMANGYSFWPSEWSVESYAYLGKQTSYIGRAFLNSIGVTVVGTALGLVMCSTMG